MFFSIPYSVPLGIFLIKILEIGYVEENKFLFIVLFSICIYLSSFPLRFVFPKNKIETLGRKKTNKQKTISVFSSCDINNLFSFYIQEVIF